MQARARVAQLADAAALNAEQCGFESRPGHKPAADPRPQ